MLVLMVEVLVMTSSHASASRWSLPSEARARALRQHATIRTLLWSAASTALAAEQGSTAARADLLSLVAELRRVLEDHLVCEEALLIPSLEARRLATEHARKRSDLALLTALAASGDFTRLSRELSRLFSNLTVDMEYEERTFLAAEV